jgi:DNA-binding transcriptional regulator YdaS (Cro superfamily)
MDRQELDALATRLVPAQAAQTEQRWYQQRGGRRRRAPGAGGRPLLGDADRILITIVYLRQVCSQKVLSELLEVNPTSIGQAIAETRQLLEEHRCSVTPTTLRFSHPNDLLDYLDHGIIVSRPRLPEVLSDPALTGMSRQELQRLTERLALGQAAQTERRRHRRRGRQRLPGTRGGVFRQKITDAERVLAAVLSVRGVCTRRVLAELLGVSPRTIGNALLDVRPLLEHDGYATAPAR